MVRRFLMGAALLLAACGIRNPVKNTIVIEPGEDRRRVTVTVRTELLELTDKVKLPEITSRFNGIDAESERTVYEKTRGTLRRVEKTARIDADNLQRLLSDCGTVQLTDGERWMELAIYPSSSPRATRQQREHVESQMHRLSADVARYLRALDRVYTYLDHVPHRATPVFTILFSDKEERSTIEDEDALLTDLNKTMATLVDHMDDAREQGVTLDEEFDLVFNPLPAEIIVRTPAPIVSFEGFEKRDDHTVAIPLAGLVDAISSLDGRWASPDPLAIIAHSSDTNTAMPKPEDVAAQQRHSSPTVTAEEIEKALAARVKPAAAYRVRWSVDPLTVNR